MTWGPTGKAYGYLGLVVGAIALAFAVGRPEAVVLAVPFAVALASGLSTAHRLGLNVEAGVDQVVVNEGEPLVVRVKLAAGTPVAGLEAYFAPSAAFATAGKLSGRPLGRRLAAGAITEVTFALEAVRWGNQEVGQLYLRARSLWGLLESETCVVVHGLVTVYPRPEALRALVRSRWASLAAGAQVGHVKASGVEMAGVRAYAVGDRARDVNWRVSARYQGLYTNERHPERATDVVLALDTFDLSVLTEAVRAACALATAYLEQRDRLALVKFGGSLRWLRPGMGLRQMYHVVSNLLSTSVAPSALWKGVDLLPPRILPAHALVVCLSSLEDRRSRAAVANMRGRGLDVVVVEVPPQAQPAATPTGLSSHRLWQMQRAMTRDSLRSMGVPTAEWWPGRPLFSVIEELNAWSRRSGWSRGSVRA